MTPTLWAIRRILAEGRRDRKATTASTEELRSYYDILFEDVELIAGSP